MTKEFLEHKNLDVYYDVSIQNEYGYFGYSNIQIQHEGMLCRTYKERWNKVKKEKIKLIRWSKLDKVKIIDLYNYIFENNLMKLDSITEPDLSMINHRGYINIRYFDLVNEKSNYLKYGYYNEKIDTLIKMVNELIPKRYRKLYCIKIAWIPGTSR